MNKWPYLLPLLLFFSGCAGITSGTRNLLNTSCEIKVSGVSRGKALRAIDAAFREVERASAIFNFYDSKSELSRVNRLAYPGPVRVSAELFSVLEDAVKISEITDGAFDVSIAPVVSLWKSRFSEGLPPQTSEIRQLLSLVDYRNMVLNRNDMTVSFTKKGMRVDLGGIAKGYAVKLAAGRLREYGIRNALINFGGDIQAIGSRRNDTPWKVGIRHPRSNRETLLTTIEVSDRCVFTSGDYERFFIFNGIRYHHIIDPKTGYPARGCVSFTIITDDPVYADGLATGCFILGPVNGPASAKRVPHTDFIVVEETDKGGVRVSSSMNLPGISKKSP